jgi:cytoplasmic iron level regulating protein YaaA (DUF328/UPF0246 family)
MLLLTRKACAITLGVLSPYRFRLLHSSSIMASEQEKKTGIMMILSPAKTMDLSPFEDDHSLQLTQPDCNLDGTGKIAQAMKTRKEKDIEKLLGISANLAKTAAGYWKEYDGSADDSGNFKPCIYAFSGAAYQGLQVKECDGETVAYMQNCLRIVDPLYGLLRPLDRIQPYRLEMATRGVFKDEKTIKLADFWTKSVTDSLSEELETFSDPILLNLASDEYSAALDESRLPDSARYIKVVFWENGRVVSVHAKRARGLMVRYIAESKSTSIDDVKEFVEEGYSFQEDKSDFSTLVFDRPKQTATKRAASAPAKSSKKRTKR